MRKESWEHFVIISGSYIWSKTVEDTMIGHNLFNYIDFLHHTPTYDD